MYIVVSAVRSFRRAMAKADEALYKEKAELGTLRQ